MKKKMIAAGAASLALAAMPVVGVFAAANPSNWVDQLQVTITDTCTWTRVLSTEATGVSISSGTAEAATAIASATMTAGQTIEDFAVSTINAKCNNDSGYQITGTFTDLDGWKSNSKGAGNTIADKITYGGAAAVSAGTWVAKLGSSETGLASGTAGNVASTSKSDVFPGGSTYVIHYDVETATDQSAGYYEGTATYALTQNS